MATAVDQKLEELRSLQNRKQILEDAAKEQPEGSPALEAFNKEIEKWDKMINDGMIEIRESVPEFALRAEVDQIAQEYVDRITSAYEEAGVEMKRLPTPVVEEDGTLTVTNAPRVPGLNIEKRHRTSTKGRILDLSGLNSEVSHSFRGGDTITGTLQTDKVSEYDGQVWEGKMSDLLDNLYQTEDGNGFFSYITEKGATQSAFTVFTSKAGGVLADPSTATASKPSRNGKKNSSN